MATKTKKQKQQNGKEKQKNDEGRHLELKELLEDKEQYSWG